MFFSSYSRIVILYPPVFQIPPSESSPMHHWLCLPPKNNTLNSVLYELHYYYSQTKCFFYTNNLNPRYFVILEVLITLFTTKFCWTLRIKVALLVKAYYGNLGKIQLAILGEKNPMLTVSWSRSNTFSVTGFLTWLIKFEIVIDLWVNKEKQNVFSFANHNR